MKLIDITGQRFGRLTVIEKLPPRKGGGSDWLCRCDCGKETKAIGSNLRKGDTTSCGCAAKEWAAKMGANSEYIKIRAEKALVHGHKRKSGMSPEYRTWLNIKRRCYDKGCKDYENWGGRGIAVCERWIDSFENFLADMGPRPERLTIDRKDPNKDYSPDNCRWATVQEQGAENRRSLIPVIVRGQSFTNLLAACTYFKVKYSTVANRLHLGVDVETAFFTQGKLPRRKP